MIKFLCGAVFMYIMLFIIAKLTDSTIKYSQEDFSNEIKGQFDYFINKIDKGLMKSLRRKPYGYGEYKIYIKSKDMQNALIKYYQKNYVVYTGEDYKHW